MRADTPKGFNPAALEVIDFLGGDRSTGMCFCPCHDDGANPSLQVRNGDRVPVVLHCFGVGTKEHDLEVIAYLKANKKWPTSSALSRDQSSSQAEKARSLKDRRRYALKIWKELRRLQRHRDLRHLLGDYLQRRGIEKVPETALAVVPMEIP
jgi:Zn-finger protein